MKQKSWIELSVNGDPYVGVYRGDIGAQSRAWWRRFCRKNGMGLKEVRHA